MNWQPVKKLFDAGLRAQVHAFEASVSNWVQTMVGLPEEMARARQVRLPGSPEVKIETGSFQSGAEGKVTRVVVETELEGWFSTERARAKCSRFGTEYTYGQSA